MDKENLSERTNQWYCFKGFNPHGTRDTVGQDENDCDV